MERSPDNPDASELIERFPVDGIPELHHEQLKVFFSRILFETRELVIELVESESKELEQAMNKRMASIAGSCALLDRLYPISSDEYVSYQVDNALIEHVVTWPEEATPELGNPKWFQWFGSVLNYSLPEN